VAKVSPVLTPFVSQGFEVVPEERYELFSLPFKSLVRPPRGTDSRPAFPVTVEFLSS